MPWQGTNVVDPYVRPGEWLADLGLSSLDEFVDDTTE
jgi:hypothetical protein